MSDSFDRYDPSSPFSVNSPHSSFYDPSLPGSSLGEAFRDGASLVGLLFDDKFGWWFVRNYILSLFLYAAFLTSPYWVFFVLPFYLVEIFWTVAILALLIPILYYVGDNTSPEEIADWWRGIRIQRPKRPKRVQKSKLLLDEFGDEILVKAKSRVKKERVPFNWGNLSILTLPIGLLFFVVWLFTTIK